MSTSNIITVGALVMNVIFYIIVISFLGDAYALLLLVPFVSIAGFISSIVSIKRKDLIGLAIPFLILHSLVIMFYIIALIYALFFWNPKFL